MASAFLGYIYIYFALRILTPPMETPDPPNDTPGASKQVVLTPHDIPRFLRVNKFQGCKHLKCKSNSDSKDDQNAEQRLNFKGMLG